MLRGIVRLCDRIARPLGGLMRDPRAKARKGWPKADAVIAMAFAQRKDGLVNLPTQAIVEKTARLYSDGLARRVIFFGSGQVNNITEAQAMAMKAEELGVGDKVISKIEKPEESLLATDFRKDLAIKECYIPPANAPLSTFCGVA